MKASIIFWLQTPAALCSHHYTVTTVPDAQQIYISRDTIRQCHT